ncbi:MAG: hypothetical protein J6U53_04295 [Tidjanibacter sp.]|nr:hypothetical protein [Tidjanibacter sp.]
MKNSQATPQRLFGASEQPEISFNANHYDQVWLSLLDSIGESNYFNGRVTTEHNEFTSTLTTTLIIYRDRHDPERPITHLAPIWWEMTTYDSEGNELPNDFSLKELLEKKLEH